MPLQIYEGSSYEAWEKHREACEIGLERAAEALKRLTVNPGQLALFVAYRSSYEYPEVES